MTGCHRNVEICPRISFGRGKQLRSTKFAEYFYGWLSNTGELRPRPHEPAFKRKLRYFAPDTTIVHSVRPKTITEIGGIPKGSPEWSDLKTLFSSVDGEIDSICKRRRHQNRQDRAPDPSTVSIQNVGQTLLCGFSLDRRCSVDGKKTIRKR